MPSYTPKGLILPTPPTLIARNLCTDPFLRNTANNLQNSVGVLTEVLVGGPNGNGYLEYDMDVANTTSPIAFNPNSGVGNRIPVVAGQEYNVSGWWSKDSVESRISRFDVTWYNSANNTISTTTSGDLGSVVGDFVRKSHVFVAPANAAYCTPSFAWSGAYSSLPVMRMADIQITEGPELKPFTPNISTLDDGDYVDRDVLNGNLDRISLMGVGGRPVLSSEHPAFGSIDDNPGTIIFETDNEGILVRRRGGSTAQGNLDTDYRHVSPGEWAEVVSNNIWSSWLSGESNRKHIRVALLGRLVHVHLEARIGSGGSVLGGAILPSQLPTNTERSVENGYGGDQISDGPWPIGHATAYIGGNSYFGRIVMILSQPAIRTISTSNTDGGAAWGPTSPATWAVGDGFTADFMYWST